MIFIKSFELMIKKTIILWGNLAGLFAWGWILYHLVMILTHGQVVIAEHNLCILMVEIAICPIVVILSGWVVINTVKGLRD